MDKCDKHGRYEGGIFESCPYCELFAARTRNKELVEELDKTNKAVIAYGLRAKQLERKLEQQEIDFDHAVGRALDTTPAGRKWLAKRDKLEQRLEKLLNQKSELIDLNEKLKEERDKVRREWNSFLSPTKGGE